MKHGIIVDRREGMKLPQFQFQFQILFYVDGRVVCKKNKILFLFPVHCFLFIFLVLLP